MKATAEKMRKQENFDFDVFYGKLVMHGKLKDLTIENIALHKVKDFDSIPISEYIEIISGNSKHALKAKYDIDFVIKDSNEMINELKCESNFPDIKKNFIYNALSNIFKLHFIGKYFMKYADNDEVDENGIPVYYSFRIKELINLLYPVCEAICATPQSHDFIDLIDAHADKRTENWTFVNRALIITKILLGNIRSGRDITRLLFERIPQDIDIPHSFKKLCRIKNGRYIIFNTDYHTFDFQLAFLDLLQFEDFNNKLLFNNKLNQYVKTFQAK